MYTFNDIAIPIAWPDKTALGDEKWMAFLKQIGLVKNLHFKVGHAAILLIERTSGAVLYFDFGRYLSPRGYGRARSAHFDPRLKMTSKARVTRQGDIENIDAILEELTEKEEATHGGGRTFYSISHHVSFAQSVAYAEKLVIEGPVLYGALAKENNSCSRFVAQVLTEGMDIDDKRRRKILYPECLKASPMSNVVNGTSNEEIFCHEKGIRKPWKMTRKASLLFQFGLLKDNFTKKGSQHLACDQTPGMIEAPPRPAELPERAQWMGGIGEGAWFHLGRLPDKNVFVVHKYAASGKLEYKIQATCIQTFDITRPYTFTPNFLHKNYSIIQDNNLYIFSATEALEQADKGQENIRAIL